MYARTTTAVAQPDRIDEGIRLVNDELMPKMTDIDGWMGLSLLVDRSSGRCIAATSWESEDAMRASAEQLQPVRKRLLAAMGSEDPVIQEWEIAVLHRDHASPAGACARVTWGRPQEGQLDDAVAGFKANVLPGLDNQRGFCSASMLVSREAGLICGTASFESKADLEASREFAQQMRATMTERTGIEFVDVLECELPVHHLRVPEHV